MQIDFTRKFGLQHESEVTNFEIPSDVLQSIAKMPELRHQAAELKRSMRKVLDNELAVRFENGDIDIVKPTYELGAIWIPIAIGAVVVAGIIARWAYLEREITTVESQFNGLLDRADKHICSDPKSEICAKWKAAKLNGGYKKRESTIESIKRALTGAGSYVKSGLSIAAIVAVPFLVLALKGKK